MRIIIDVSRYFCYFGISNAKIKVVTSYHKNGMSYYFHFKNKPILKSFVKLLMQTLEAIK